MDIIEGVCDGICAYYGLLVSKKEIVTTPGLWCTMQKSKMAVVKSYDSATLL